MLDTVLIHGEPLKAWPRDLFIPPDALLILLESFSGPLDLLLYLVRKQNLDILNIPIVQISEQYVAYIAIMQEMRIELAAEYLLMAAWLAEIKSRLLLPTVADQENPEADPRTALMERLQAYEQITHGARALAARPQWQRDVFPAEAALPILAEVALPSVQISDLLSALSEILKRAAQTRDHAVARERYSVRDSIRNILDFFSSDPTLKANLAELILLAGTARRAIVVHFLAVLELLREQKLEYFEPNILAIKY